ncbi:MULTISPECIES: hypothetical protein [unclassified Cobetia]|uniref:hypothetical protein n=1 Tax=unclassified Cobetia TaxID=2609414 RepID=UPI00178CE35F|nr:MULTISPECIES: hypothetical protein [unclassified Cobetia]MBE2167452.1 hypothetical protein [Cobetia sp. 2AS1]MDH2447103.1 hypothetical protein [Cobetia sp. 2AS]
MRINNKLIQVNQYGMYSANAIFNALDKPRVSPNAYIQEISEQNVSSYDSEELYEVKYGSKPGVFLCDYLTYDFLLRNKYEHLLKIKGEMEADKLAQFMIRFKNSDVFQDERSKIFNEGYQKGQQDFQEKLNKDGISRPLEISLLKLWSDSVGPESHYLYEDFVRHAQITSFLFLDAGKGEVLSRYDWESETYWITPEFGFYLLAFFPAVSSEMRNGLRSLISYTKGNIWRYDVA